MMKLNKQSEHTSSPPGKALAHIVGATYSPATARVRASCLCSNKKGKHDVKPHRVLTLTMTSKAPKRSNTVFSLRNQTELPHPLGDESNIHPGVANIIMGIFPGNFHGGMLLLNFVFDATTENIIPCVLPNV